MSFFGSNKHMDLDRHTLDRRNTRQPMSARSKKMMWLLIVNTVCSLLIYFGCVGAGFSEILFVYIGLAALLLVVYVVYNRGFVLRGATPDMLSDEWTKEQKVAMIADAGRRADSSRFVLAFIVPLLIAVLIDAVYLLLLQDLLLSLGVSLG